jgi:hypothetical protein
VNLKLSLLNKEHKTDNEELQMMEELSAISSNAKKVLDHEALQLSSKHSSVPNVAVALHIISTSVISVALTEKRFSKLIKKLLANTCSWDDIVSSATRLSAG